jgi:DegV family protein with EDD domain
MAASRIINSSSHWNKMTRICIITDSTVQFPNHAFPGKNLVNIIPMKSRLFDQEIGDDVDFKVNLLPQSAKNGVNPFLFPPSVDDFQEFFLGLSATYNEAVAILLSSHLNPAFDNAMLAADLVRGKISIQVIDSQTISAGLGMLVQVAAEDASRGVRMTDIEHKIRGLIPHVYSLFCVHGLTYLSKAGYIGPAQASIGEMLSLIPVFTFEDGHLVALEKVKNFRQLMDYYIEFIDEFSDLYQISLIQSYPTNSPETHILRDHALSNFSKTPFSEHPINLPLATLFGPNTLGIITMESPDANHF